MKEEIRRHGHGPWNRGPGFGGPGGPEARERWHGRERGGENDRRGFFGGDGPGRPWGRGHGGHGGRERLERGLLRYVILYVLRDGPKHGYEVIKHLEERTGGFYSPSPGTLYPTLQYMEDLGLVKSDQDEGRRVYQLTDAGRADLEEHIAMAEGFWNRFRDRMPSGGARHEVKFLLDAMHDLTRTVHGGLRGAMFAGDHETIRRVRLALESCQNEIREILAKGAQAPAADWEGPEEPETPSAVAGEFDA